VIKSAEDRYVEQLLSDGTSDIVVGFISLFIGWMLGIVNYILGVTIGLGLAGYFFFTFLRDLRNREKIERYFARQALLEEQAGQKNDYSTSLTKDRMNIQRSSTIPPTPSESLTDEPTIADRIKEIHKRNDFKCPSCGASVLPTDIKCKYCDSIIVVTADLPKPARWGDIEIGNPVHIKHPKQGELVRSVVHRIYHGELWQTEMQKGVPWTLTGNYYVGLGLGDELYLLNWQSRFYILDSKSPLTDMDINQKFSQPAREFAASNQTRNVTFVLETIWQMEDIGRYRIEFAEGESARVGAGAVGRFIHASHDNRILVVEDYQMGGSGLDTLWMGYQIKESDIKF